MSYDGVDLPLRTRGRQAGPLDARTEGAGGSCEVGRAKEIRDQAMSDAIRTSGKDESVGVAKILQTLTSVALGFQLLDSIHIIVSEKGHLSSALGQVHDGDPSAYAVGSAVAVACRRSV